MDIGRLRKIISYNNLHKEEIETQVKRFYAFAGMDMDRELLNVPQIAYKVFLKKGFLLLGMPIFDSDIGALTYKGDSLGYILINTAKPKVNMNFSICHEIYHAFFQEKEFKSGIRFDNNYCCENENEYAANQFAGIFLMPENSFRHMYNKFKQECDGDELDTMIQLMNYYKVPYMSVLVRCYELELPDRNTIPEEYLQIENEVIRERFRRLWLDMSILSAWGRDDFLALEDAVETIGRENIEQGYLNQRTLDKVLKNIRTLYTEIKGD